MTKYTKLALTTAGVAGTLACGGNAIAQSDDALLNKLVQKGILTDAEAKDLRKESDKEFAKHFNSNLGLPEWVNSFKLYGDFRGRFEHFDTDNSANVDRNRFRYRARFGFKASLWDDFEIGMRLASGSAVNSFGGNPVSANTDLGDGASRKFVWVDAAYAKWTPVHSDTWMFSSTFGKMDNPFTLSPMVFDPDYQPEGLAVQAAYSFNPDHQLKFTGAGFILDEFNQGPAASHDPFMIAGQLSWDAKWSKRLESSVTVAGLAFGNTDNLLNGAAPNVNDGNTRNSAGAPQYNFNPILVGGSLTYKFDDAPLYKGAFPVKLGGEYMNNPAAPSNNDGWWVGASLGKAGHKGLWEVAWKYERLEGDAMYEEIVDDDFGAYYQQPLPNSGFNSGGYRGGTNVKGHVFKGTYNLTDALSMSFTYYLTELVNPSPAGSVSDSSHFMADLMWKF